MYAFFAVVLRIFSNPLANVFQKQLALGGDSPFFVNFATYLLLGVLSIPFAFALDWSAFPPAFWGNALFVGLLGAVGNGLLVAAVRQGEISVLGPINAYKSVVGLAFGVLLLGEIPGVFGCLGLALIVFGSYFAVTVRATPGQRPGVSLLRRRDIQLRFAAMIVSAIEAIFIKRVILHSGPEASMITWCWFGALFAFGIVLLGRKNLPAQVRSAFSRRNKFVLLALAVGVMQLSTNYAFRHMHVGYALALFQLSALVSLAFGYHFFKERGMVRKLLGATIMIAGSVMIILLP